jgi:hypothetical protein
VYSRVNLDQRRLSLGHVEQFFASYVVKTTVYLIAGHNEPRERAKGLRDLTPHAVGDIAPSSALRAPAQSKRRGLA